MFLQPEIRGSFHLLDPVGLGDGPPKPRKNVDMILYAADSERSAFQFLGNTAHVGMQRGAQIEVAQKRAAILGRKHRVQINGRERLRHGVSPVRGDGIGCGFRESNPNGIPPSSPRLAECNEAYLGNRHAES